MGVQGEGITREHEDSKTEEAPPDCFDGWRQCRRLNNLQVIYTNADGFINKRQDLKQLLNSLTEKPDVIIITETKSKMLQEKFYRQSLTWKDIIVFVRV